MLGAGKAVLLIAAIGLSWTAAYAQPKLWCEYAAGDGPGHGRHIVLISGDEEYRSEEALPMLGKILSQRHGFKVTVLFAIDPATGEINPNEQKNIPGMDAIDSADLVILALRYRCLPDDQMKHFADYVDAGKPLIGLRTSTHAFNYPAESQSPYRHFGGAGEKWNGGFGKQVLGETWVSHHGHHKVESTRGVVAEKLADHSIVRGVDDVWGPTDVYGINDLPDDAQVLLYGQVLQGMKPDDPPVVGEKNEPMMPLAWTRAYTSESGSAARVFCTTMGSADDFLCEDLRRLIVNAAFWCLGSENLIEGDLNVDLVGDYQPTPYGFDGFQKGKRPADHALPNDPAQGDPRLGRLKTLDDHFPFAPPASVDAWRDRSARVRQRLLVALGLHPYPQKTPLNAVIHGCFEADDYIVQKAYFESLPGFFVTGNVYRPKNKTGPFPGVLCPHGHWNQGRFYDAGSEAAAREVAAGAELDPEAARVPLQARCVHLARMGCIVFHYDMVGYADCQQIGIDVAHGFAHQRPEMNSPDRWGFYSPQAEGHLQSIMGLQTWNSIRALDFLETFPDIDRSRIGVTGASGGGTQTMILGAVDPRPHAIFPAVMVSTSMQGGCTCENTSLLRIGTGNVEFAALFAPKAQGLTAADDWTRDMSRDGFPELQKIYALLGHPDNVRLCSRTEFGHNYNAVSRAAMYEMFNEAFHLDADTRERPFPRLTPEQLSVWDRYHSQPTGGDDFERDLLQTWRKLQQRGLEATNSRRAIDVSSWSQPLHSAFQVIFDRELKDQVTWRRSSSLGFEEGSYDLEYGEFVNASQSEHTPAVIVRPFKEWNGRYVICLNEQGRNGVVANGNLTELAQKLVAKGYRVVGIDCYWQGDLLPADQDPTKARLVENGREAAGYTFGYNHCAFVRQVHDGLNAVSYLSAQDSSVDIYAADSMSTVAVAVRALVGSHLRKAAIDTRGFRFAHVKHLRDLRFLPGSVKYGDLPALIALGAPHDLWLAGENDSNQIFDQVYRTMSAGDKLLRRDSIDGAIDWLAQ